MQLGFCVEDQCGVIDFEDGLTVVSLTVGFIAAFALLNGTLVRCSCVAASTFKQKTAW